MKPREPVKRLSRTLIERWWCLEPASCGGGGEKQPGSECTLTINRICSHSGTGI